MQARPARAKASRYERSRALANLAALLALSLLSGCATPPAAREPLNLDTAKAAVVRYHDSGDYARDLAAVAVEARAWIEQRAARRAPAERLAVVFDIDETLLSNYPHIAAQGFGYVPREWAAWVARGEAPALAPVREVFLAARKLGLAVFLVTGREEPRDRAATEANLRRAGLGDYTRLIMLPAGGQRRTNAEYKTAARRTLTDEGYTIIANLGDQASDLTGGHAERTFKLPNPLYLAE
ncbi:MAG: HAD family acid phosphatase [Opitutae bacterium]|nr:HAD family acid phosphatase [Opitutae bacterium]